MEKLVSVKNLYVKYGSFTAVDNVSFDIEAGEIVAMIGPNGSGKSSSVECVEGLRFSSGGEVRVFGKDPFVHRQEVYTSMGVQLQDTTYPDKIRVGELCALFASFYDKPANWQRLLVELGLEPKKKKSVSSLSGGEKQRLSILLALLPKPKLLMLDELTTGLDPEIRRSLWDSLKIIRDSGVGILLVSHYMEEVEALAGRVVFMLNSKAIYTGTLAGLREYAKSVISKEEWSEDFSLEDIYLLLVPRKKQLSLEALS